MSPLVPVAVEVGTKRTFATAVDWPGWCRAGRDEDDALEQLVAYGPRYRAAIHDGVRSFTPPRSVARLEVIERLPGDATTDFGAPGTAPTADDRPVSARDLTRLGTLMRACWGAFDRAADAASGETLRTGPRGGGRDLAGIRDHVAGADEAYLRSLGGTVPDGTGPEAAREAFVDALGARARGELPDVGPRGGSRWSARYAARRSAWHVLDHAWEIEDRADDRGDR
jgi:hypothetical protein